MYLAVSENKSFLELLNATDRELEQLRLSLTRRIKNWRFHPKVKRGYWDGYISYMLQDRYIPIGLWKEVYDVCKKYDFDIKFDGLSQIFDNSIPFEKFEAWCNKLMEGHPEDLKPRPYQIETAHKILRFKKCAAEVATAGGKTLLTYLIISYLLKAQKAKKILMIVPNTSLVIQGHDDFHNYNHKGYLDLDIQMIYSGQKIKEKSNIVIGTYQSLVKKNEAYFAEFDCVIVDEMHKVKAASIKTILEKCKTAEYRFGLTGTFPKPGTLDILTVMSYTGPLISEINAAFLQDKGYVTPCNVTCIHMDYAPETIKDSLWKYSRSSSSANAFQQEQNYIIQNKPRLDFICKLAGKVKNNTLILFHRREYGEKLYKHLREYGEKDVYYVDGRTDSEIREMYKKKMENNQGIILIASYGTFSTGISVKNIHNIFFTESFKSDVIIRQSIGRGLRLHKSKSMLNIYDFIDDLRINGWENYIFRHGKERREIYKDQQFPYKIKKVKI